MALGRALDKPGRALRAWIAMRLPPGLAEAPL
jgi:hypothetical protein